MTALRVVPDPDPLDAAEATRLGELEAVIERGLRTFVEVGLALDEIRERRLYRESFETFEGYCRARWGFVASRARQLIAAADVVTSVTVAGLPGPANEAQARELAKLRGDAVSLLEAWQEAQQIARNHGKDVTAADVRAAVAAKLQQVIKPKPKPLVWPTFPPPSETAVDLAYEAALRENPAWAWDRAIAALNRAIVASNEGAGIPPDAETLVAGLRRVADWLERSLKTQ